jgi:hypothetical protein
MMLGSTDERCHPARWSCAGRVVSVLPSAHRRSMWVAASELEVTPTQLSLFAA